MTPRATLQQIARLVRDDLLSNNLSAGVDIVGDMVVQQPDALSILVDLAGSEGRKKRPDKGLYNAYVFMFGETVEQLRLRSEAGQGQAAIALDDVRAVIARQVHAGKLQPAAAFALVSAFTRAGLDVGEDVRSALDGAMTQIGSDPNRSMPDPSELLKGLAEACDGDPFRIQSEFSEMTAVMPAELQVALLSGLVLSETIGLREAAIGWLLAESAVAMPLAELIEAAAKRGLVTAASVVHLMLMRNWVAEDRRRAIDAIIKAAQSVAHEPEKRPAIQVRELLMSQRDGAGAQSLFAWIREGRKNALVSILVKQGHGVRDAWVARPISKIEIEDMLDHLSGQMMLHETTADDVTVLLRSALADGDGTVRPPFGLIQAVRYLGLTDVTPHPVSAETLVASMLADVDETATNRKAVTKALRKSGQWPDTMDQFESWFEHGDDVAVAIAGKRKVNDRLTAILETVLEPKRGYWASIIGWSAFAERGDGESSDWIDMALVARELVSDRPLVDQPVARAIAERTLLAVI